MIELAGLTAAGGLLGTALSAWFVRLFVWWAGSSLPRLAEVAVDPAAVTFAAVVTALAALVCGLVPGVQATRDVAAFPVSVDVDHRGAIGSARQQRVRRLFVALQIAASFVLLMALGRTEDFRVVGRPDPPPDQIPQVHFRIVMPRYFATLGIAITEGREFTDDDRERSARVAIISRSFADRYWPFDSRSLAQGRPFDSRSLAQARTSTGPIGAHLRVGDSTVPLEIVGVAADVKQFTLDAPPTAELYVPLRQMPAADAPFVAARMYWVVRTASEPSAIATAVRREIQAIDGDIATRRHHPGDSADRAPRDRRGSRRRTHWRVDGRALVDAHALSSGCLRHMDVFDRGRDLDRDRVARVPSSPAGCDDGSDLGVTDTVATLDKYVIVVSCPSVEHAGRG